MNGRAFLIDNELITVSTDKVLSEHPGQLEKPLQIQHFFVKKLIPTRSWLTRPIQFCKVDLT